MNQLSTSNSKTMNSREIADLVEKRHDNVTRTIESLYEKGVIGLPQFEEVPNPGPGPLLLKQYRLEKRDTYVLVAQLSPEFTARLVDRWQELESAQVAAIPPTYAEALRLAADQAEQIEQQQAALAIAAPKVEFVDRYVESTGNKGFREVAKLLGANEARFREFLLSKGVMYRLAGSLTPMAQHLDAGRFVVKAGANEESGHAFTQAKFTAKGIAWIAGQWMEWKLEQGDAA